MSEDNTHQREKQIFLVCKTQLKVAHLSCRALPSDREARIRIFSFKKKETPKSRKRSMVSQNIEGNISRLFTT